MKALFNDGWVFSEYGFDSTMNYKDGEPVLLTPDEFLDISKTQTYKSVEIPHDWMIYHVKNYIKTVLDSTKRHLNLLLNKLKKDIMLFDLKECI